MKKGVIRAQGRRPQGKLVKGSEGKLAEARSEERSASRHSSRDHCPAKEHASANEPLRQQQAGHEPNDERKSIQATLTRKNLALFDRIAGKAEGNEDLNPYSTEAETTVTSTSDFGFCETLFKNGIMIGYNESPTNKKEILERFRQPRESPSPTESMFEAYRHKIQRAYTEADTTHQFRSKLLKEHVDESYQQGANHAFSTLPRDLGFNNNLSAPQPDFVEGLEEEAFDPFPVAEHVEGAVLYRARYSSMALPHIAGEFKGPQGSMAKAEDQIAYSGAALVHGRDQALKSMGKADPSGHAEVMTFTTDGKILNVYAHYAMPSADGKPKYHHNLVETTGLMANPEGFKDSYRVLRNVQDHAREQSYRLRDQLKSHWTQQRRDLQAGASANLPHEGDDNGTLDEMQADGEDRGNENAGGGGGGGADEEASCRIPAAAATPSQPEGPRGRRKRKAAAAALAPDTPLPAKDQGEDEGEDEGGRARKRARTVLPPAPSARPVRAVRKKAQKKGPAAKASG